MLTQPGRPKRRYSAAFFSILAHVAIVAAILASRQPAGAHVEAPAPKVTFFSIPPPPPPPPPPAAPKARPRTVKKTEPKLVEPVKEPDPVPTKPTLKQVE